MREINNEEVESSGEVVVLGWRDDIVKLLAEGEGPLVVVNGAGIDDFPANRADVRTVIFVAEANEIAEVFPDLLRIACGEQGFLRVDTATGAADRHPCGAPAISKSVVCVKRYETRWEVVWIACQSVVDRGAKVVVAPQPHLPQLVHLGGVIVDERNMRSLGNQRPRALDPLVKGPDHLDPLACPSHDTCP